jgi:hypothetical protein
MGGVRAKRQELVTAGDCSDLALQFLGHMHNREVRIASGNNQPPPGTKGH